MCGILGYIGNKEIKVYYNKIFKNGNKIWSQAIRLEGYNEGICNKIIKDKNEFIFITRCGI